MVSASTVDNRGPVPALGGLPSDGIEPSALGLGRTPDCPSILQLNPAYRGWEWTPAEKRHIERCDFCQSWIKKFECLESSSDDANSILNLLEEVEAVECEFDYGLPSGKRCDTFVDISKLCASEEAMHRVASAFDLLFADTDFDTIVVNSWPLAMIAQRLAFHRKADERAVTIPIVLTEGYAPEITFTEDILSNAKVLLLVDTVVTGAHLDCIRRGIGKSLAQVAGIGALFLPRLSPCPRMPEVRFLCEMDMEICDPPADEAPLFGAATRKQFHPLAHCMAEIVPEPINASDYLKENPRALELWASANQAQAYEPHRVFHRKNKDRHYNGFFDTLRLLRHKTIGPRMVYRLRDRLSERFPIPQVILIPSRRQKRSMKLATMLVNALKESDADIDAPIICARRNAGGNRTLAPDDEKRIAGRAVLVLDVAVGRGSTIDSLARLAKSANASGVGAAVLISRLTENGEKAFDCLFEHGFCSVYNYPVGPVDVDGPDASICARCFEKELSNKIDKAFGIRAHKKRRGNPDGNAGTKVSNEHGQRSFFWTPHEFLAECSPAIASGIVLHALHSSMQKGMARLELPELNAVEIGWRTKRAILRNLPPGTVAWSGKSLHNDLTRFLGRAKPANWIATAGVFGQEGDIEWLESIDAVLHRGKLTSTFWSDFTRVLCVTATKYQDAKAHICQHLAECSQRFPEYAIELQRTLRLVRHERRA